MAKGFLQFIGDGCKAAVGFVDKKSPAFLTGIGIAGTIATGGLCILGTVKAMNDIYDKAEEDPEWYENATKWDIVKLVWHEYIPAGISAAVAIAAEVGASAESDRRLTVATAAADFWRKSAHTYKEEVIEQFGKNKEKKIQAEVDHKQIQEAPPTKEFVDKTIPIMSENDLMFRDPMTGQYFISNIDKVKAAARKANLAMREDRVYLNDLLYDCGANFSDIGRDYYLDYFETGEIYVEDFIRYSEEEIHGHTFIIGTLSYDCKNRYN